MSRSTPAWLIVAKREVLAKVTNRTFLVGTLVTLALIVGLLAAQALLSQRTKTYDLAVTQDGRAVATQVAEAASKKERTEVKVHVLADDRAAKAAVRDETADAWLHSDGDGWVLTGRSEVPGPLLSLTRDVVRSQALSANAAAAGTTVSAIEKGSALETRQLIGDPDRSMLNDLLTLAMAFLFYVAVLMFGITLANSVVEEKQSRIVEIIVSAIPVRHLLAGKVLGNSLIALVQITLYVVVGLVGLSFTDLGRLLPAVTGPVLWFVLFFAVGFLAVACLYAVAGALASRTEDVQATSMPLTMLVMAIFFAGMFTSGQTQTVLSFVPPVSPVVMPARLLEGGVPLWQPLVSLALLLVFAALAVAAGERIYRRALLQTQGRVSLRQAWSTAE